jgi:hypothetical protein
MFWLFPTFGAWGIDLFEAKSFDWGRHSDGAALLSFAWIFWFGAEDPHDYVFRHEIAALPRTDLIYSSRAAASVAIESWGKSHL